MSPPFLFADELRQRIAANLALHEVVALQAEGARPAAVGVVLIADDVGRACFVLTRRAAALRRHSGQWALPGGRLDADESAVDAALREIREEIGLALPAESVVGRLDDFLSRSRHLITPFVFWAAAATELQLDAREVAAAYRVPLDELDRPQNPVRQPLLHFEFDVPGTTVYAPTAAILFQFREQALHARHVRVADEEQPYFAWR
ncbi:MAG: CoA pyrophosphatase [Chloroflexi bacterium]|nr:CoA pyrophosphatase [Chloroflexota bacterium]